jgi:exodeoxyribonuclease VIII
MNEKEYRQSEGLSQSELNMFIRSPRLYHAVKSGTVSIEQTSAMVFGSAFHCMILEPECFYERFVVLDRRTKDGKEKAATAESRGISVITQSDLENIQGMQESLRSHPEFKKAYGQIESVEKVLSWNETISGQNIKAKGRLDFTTKDFIWDLKTTDKPDLSFRYSIKDFGYDRQAVWYLDAEKKLDFIFIAVQKKEPYDVGFYTLSETMKQKARDTIKVAIENMKRYEKENFWPHLNQGQIITIGE